MASQIGALVSGISAKLGTTLGNTYRKIYGLPDASGVGLANAKTIRVRYLEGVSVLATGQKNGIENVSPRIEVCVSRPTAGDGSTEASHLAALDLLADVRVAILDMCDKHTDGTAPITGLSGPLWVTGLREVPSNIDLGASASQESVSIEFEFKLTRIFGGR